MNVKDIGTIIKIMTMTMSLFNVSDLQETEINNYVKDNMYRWVEERKSEEEVEEMINSAINRICGK